MYLVAADVLSEVMKPVPDSRFLTCQWDNECGMVVELVVIGEIRFGILLTPAGRRREKLESRFDAGIVRLDCLPWDATVGLRRAKLIADLRSADPAMPFNDSLTAATALAKDLTFATRNRLEFENARVRVVNPLG